MKNDVVRLQVVVNDARLLFVEVAEALEDGEDDGAGLWNQEEKKRTEESPLLVQGGTDALGDKCPSQVQSSAS